jgi:bacterioferritin
MKNTKIVGLLERAYAAELETVQNYLANSVWLDGLRAEEIKEALEEDIREELGHAQKLANRLKQLGACPPGSLKLERTQKGLQPPADSTDIMAVVKGVLAAENDAIKLYNEIIKACDGKDWVTQDLAINLLADEEKHRCLFEGFLKSLEKHGAREK